MNRDDTQQQGGHGGHGWMMIGCGVLLVAAVIWAATGRVSVGYILAAVMCIAMMAMMMSMMMGGRGQGDDKR